MHMYAASSMACRAISYGEARVDIKPDSRRRKGELGEERIRSEREGDA